MIGYTSIKEGLLAQAKDFHSLSEAVMFQEYGLVKVKSRNGKALKIEGYNVYRRYSEDLDIWEFKFVSKNGRKTFRNLEFEEWELIKEVGKPIVTHANFANYLEMLQVR